MLNFEFSLYHFLAQKICLSVSTKIIGEETFKRKSNEPLSEYFSKAIINISGW